MSQNPPPPPHASQSPTNASGASQTVPPSSQTGLVDLANSASAVHSQTQANAAQHELSTSTSTDQAASHVDAARKKSGRKAGTKKQANMKIMDWNGELMAMLCETIEKHPDSKQHKEVLELKARSKQMLGPEEIISEASIKNKSSDIRKAAAEIDFLQYKIEGNDGYQKTLTEEEKTDEENMIAWKDKLVTLYKKMGSLESAVWQAAFRRLGEALNGAKTSRKNAKNAQDEERVKKNKQDDVVMKVCF